MIAFIIVIWVVATALNTADGAITTYNCKKEGQRVLKERNEIINNEWLSQSKEMDCYYESNRNAIIHPNYNFYSDGSLKYDSNTGKGYQKGQYYCDSNGVMANRRTADSSCNKPPRD